MDDVDTRETRMVADERHVLMIHGDGTWSRHSAMVARRSNVEVFVEALGDRAVRIER